MSTQATPQHQEDFTAHRPLPGVHFAHDDLVEITCGEQAGNVGSLVALAALGDDPVYVVEIDTGFEVEVAQSGLKLAGD
jgi:rhodanese-related sulfurtransferase